MEGKLSLQAAEKRVHGLPIDFWSHTKSSTDTLALLEKASVSLTVSSGM